jgi:hypothetical protein
MSRGRWKFTKREVKRAVKAVEDAHRTAGYFSRNMTSERSVG